MEPEEVVETAALEPIFAMLDRHPALRELGIWHFAGDTGELFQTISDHSFAVRLDTLDLSSSDLRRDQTYALIGFLDRTPNVRTLGLDDVVLTKPDHERLAARPNLAIEGTPRIVTP